jgi:hypothetical protein
VTSAREEGPVVDSNLGFVSIEDISRRSDVFFRAITFNQS